MCTLTHSHPTGCKLAAEGQAPNYINEQISREKNAISLLDLCASVAAWISLGTGRRPVKSPPATSSTNNLSASLQPTTAVRRLKFTVRTTCPKTNQSKYRFKHSNENSLSQRVPPLYQLKLNIKKSISNNPMEHF